MSTTTNANALVFSPRPDAQSTLWLPILAVWHVIVAVLALIAALVAFQAGIVYGLDLSGAAPVVRAIVGSILVIFGVASLVAAPGLLRCKPYARNISLAINYIGFVLSVLVALQVMNVFIEIDTTARNLPNALWPFVGLILMWFAYGQLENIKMPRRATVQTVFNVIILILIIVAALQLGIINGITGFIALVPIGLPFIVPAVAFGVMAFGIFRRGTGMLFRESLSVQEAVVSWVFLSTNIIGFLMFFAVPLLISLFLSFTDYKGSAVQAPDVVGFKNYGQIIGLSIGTVSASDPNSAAFNVIAPGHDVLARIQIFDRAIIIGASDSSFWTALKNTFIWVVLIMPLSIIPALLLAVFLNSKLAGMNFYRVLFFLPVVAGVVGVALIWTWLYNADIGAFNAIISAVVKGINDLVGHPLLTDPKINWLNSDQSAQLSVVVMAAWMSIGYNMVIFIAGLQSIPRPLYEAARVDGATGFSAFRFITLPMLAPTTFFVITTTLINAFQVFTEPYTMTLSDGAGPSNSTLTMVTYMYKKGFSSGEFGYSSAIAWVLVLIIFIITLIQFRISDNNSNVS